MILSPDPPPLGAPGAGAPLILTLAMDERSTAFFETQRRRYFPPERNLIPAHLTLFHKLPGENRAAIERDLAAAAATQARFPLEVTGLRFLGRGVSYALHSPALALLRQGLASTWAPWLGPQDRQGHRPHVTVQNKADPETAKSVLAVLQDRFAPFTATAEGLQLWRYLGGPWDHLATFAFAGEPP